MLNIYSNVIRYYLIRKIFNYEYIYNNQNNNTIISNSKIIDDNMLIILKLT